MITVMRRYRKFLQIGLLVVIAAFVASLFVFGATGSKFGGGETRDSVATVNGETIPIERFQRRYQSYLEAYAQIYRDRFSTEMAERLLPRRGRLWAWTTQEFPPPSPPYAGPAGEAFVPYGVGYVELADEVKVEARLTQAEGLRHGMELELVLVPFRTDGDGNEVLTFAFRPVG